MRCAKPVRRVEISVSAGQLADQNSVLEGFASVSPIPSEMSRFGHSPHEGTLGSSTLEESPMPNLLCQCPVTKRPLRLLIGCKGKIIEDLSRLVSNPAPCEHCDQYHAWAIQDLYFEGERADSAGSVN